MVHDGTESSGAGPGGEPGMGTDVASAAAPGPVGSGKGAGGDDPGGYGLRATSGLRADLVPGGTDLVPGRADLVPGGAVPPRAPGGISTGHASGLESHGAPGHGAGRRVLVIEDEPNISEAIRFILRRDGWEVGTHDTGSGALARIEGERPDLVILDVMLPGQSGLDILQGLRARDGLADLPVILLTARGQAATRELAQGYGASMFMSKPFANADLLAAVRQLVGV